MKCFFTGAILSLIYLQGYSQSQFIDQSDWKIRPAIVKDSRNDASVINSLTTGSDFTGTTSIPAATTRSVSIKLPVLSNSGMFTFSIQSSIAGLTVNSYQSSDGTSWEVLQSGAYTNGRGDDLQKIDIPLSVSGKWFRVSFVNSSDTARNLKELGLYQFKSGVNNQYFVLLGASLSEQSGGHTEWMQTVRSRIGPSLQPIIFNWSLSGETSAGVRKRTDEFLAQHPNASCVLLEAGGNDVSAVRPLLFERKSGSDIVSLEANVRYIVQAIKNKGKIPVLSRISYRNYPSKTSWKGWDQPSVNGGINQEYGSLPFNFVLDKIIKETTPMFWDQEERRGVVDFYPFTLNNQSWLIEGDGVHFYTTTAYHIREFWADYALKYLYTGKKSPVLPYNEPVSGIRQSAEAAVRRAESSRSESDIWNARILVEQVSSRTIRIPLADRLDLLTGNNQVPEIISQPSDYTASENTKASFSVAANSAQKLTYQWQKNGTSLPGASQQVLTLSAVSLADNNAVYNCIISNSNGLVFTRYAILKVNPVNGLTASYYSNSNAGFKVPVAFTRIDENINFSWAMAPSDNVSKDQFSVRWTGKIVPKYSQEYTFYTRSDDGARLWINNQLIIDKWLYQGETEYSARINLAAGQYYDIKLEYFDGSGNAICKLFWSSSSVPRQIVPSAALFPENAVPASTAPVIVSQPVNVTAFEGSDVSFATTANSSNTLSYQWKKNGKDIAGANSGTYQLHQILLSDNSSKYSCVVSNSLGKVTSSEAVLTVNPAAVVPTIVQQPVNKTVLSGDNVQFSIVGSGTSIAYQWYKNGVILNGQISSVLKLTNVAVDSHNNRFKCKVSNQAGSAMSNEAVLTVNSLSSAPIISQQPAHISVSDGSAYTFSVQVSGAAPFTYQWYKNNVLITGAVKNIFTSSAASLQDNNAGFKCLISNNAGSVLSGTGLLSVSTLPVSVNGLTGRYYKDVYAGFSSSPSMTRTDAGINFNWFTEAPHPLISADRFAVRWTGKIQPAYTDVYTFYTQSDDGIRLWINGVLIIDNWIYQGEKEYFGSVSLTAGVKYDIKAEYFDGNGNAVCRLFWACSSVKKQIVPTSSLFPEQNMREEYHFTEKIISESGSDAFLLYPTFAENYVFIDNAPEDSQALVYTHSGLLIKEEKINSPHYQMYLNELKPGSYFIKVGDQTRFIAKE